MEPQTRYHLYERKLQEKNSEKPYKEAVNQNVLTNENKVSCLLHCSGLG
jgi:hypothetical protein